MELYQLRTFITVAEEGNLTRAASKLFTSQPAVSAQLRALEEELDIQLFERSPKGMVLTAAGTSLRAHAQQLIAAARDFKQIAEGLRGSASGDLVLGLNNRPEVLRLLPILQQLTQKYPNLRYDLQGGSSGVILHGIAEGAISFGFFEGSCEFPKIQTHQISEIHLCLIAPAAWADELSTPDWKHLESKPWIFVSPLCSYFRTIEHFCQQQGLKLQHRFRVNEDLTVLNLVAEGLGMTLIDREQVRTSPLREKVFVLPHFKASVPLSIAYLASRENDPAIRAVREVTLAVWKNEEITKNEDKTPRGIRRAANKSVNATVRTRNLRNSLKPIEPFQEI